MTSHPQAAQGVRAGAVVVFFVLLVALGINQYLAGCHEAAFALHPDEATHYLSGVMAAEYVLQRAPEPPLDFAMRYAAHYPRIGIGHYPPLLYAAQAGWFVLFGSGKASVHLLIALFSAACGALLWKFIREEWGTGYAWAMTLLWMAFPLTQYFAITVMAETLVGLLFLLALWFYKRYLEAPSWRPAAWFGVFAGLALLAKGTAIGLALVPPLAAWLSGRKDLFRQGHFWLPAIIVVAIAGPWYVWSQLNIHAMGGLINRATTLRRPTGPELRILYWRSLGGYWVALLGLAGFITRLRPAFRGRPLQPLWAVMAATVISVTAFHLYLPESEEPRHLFHASPTLALFAIAGARTCAAALSRAAPFVGRTTLRAAPAVLILLALLCFPKFQWERKPLTPYPQVVESLLALADLKDRAVLVSSLGWGDGAIIAEFAVRQPAPQTVLLRANRTLAFMGWTSRGYRLQLESVTEVEAFLESVPVAAVITDDWRRLGDFPHQALLTKAIEANDQRWRLAVEDSGVRAFVSTRPNSELNEPIKIMLPRLRRSIEIDP